MQKRLCKAIILLLLLAGIPIIPTFSQGQTSDAIVLKVAISDFYKEVLDQEALGEFEASNPGIKVKVIDNSYFYSSWGFADDQIYDITRNFATSADVLYVSSSNLTDDMTRTGYFMDLMPLIRQDSSMSADNYYVEVWNSFRWNGGFWAIPHDLHLTLLLYDPAAFDKLKLQYPTGQWTLADLKNALSKFATAARKPTPEGQRSEKIRSGSELFLFRSVLGINLFNPLKNPAMPELNTPEVAALVEEWKAIEEAELVDDGLSDIDAPISLGSPFAQGEGLPIRSWSFLPGGRAGLSVNAYAVSSGTQHPDEAYKLAKFLAGRPLTNPNLIPAQISLLESSKFSLEQQRLIEQILEQAIPASEMRFTGYLFDVIDDITFFKKSTRDALITAQEKAEQALELASARKKLRAIAVATETPTPSLKPGEVWLKFGMIYSRPLPNAEQWEALIKTFVKNDPQVKQVTIDVYEKTAANSDCLYLGYNAVPHGDLSLFTSLDTFLKNDPTFDESDVVGNLLPQFQRNGKTWGLPLELKPVILNYDTNQFAAANINAPQPGWTVADFEKALNALKKADPSKKQALLMTSLFPETTLQLLISAYGGLPIDYRASPPTLSFTDPTTVAAIRKVLDLAIQGKIQYDTAIVQNTASGRGGTFNDWALYPTILGTSAYFPANYSRFRDTYKLTTFPVGDTVSVVYSIGAGYILASSPNAAACYRWLSLVSKHPELFNAMPVRRSLFNEVDADEEAKALFKYFDKVLMAPDTLLLQLASGRSSHTSMLIERSLFKAFDQYVLEKKDLMKALQTAEIRAKKVLDCLVLLPSTRSLDWDTYVKQYTDAENCYKAADPEYHP